MFKGFGTWLGLEKTSEDKESHSVEQEEKVVEAQNEDKRNFLRDPPAGVQFHFDMEQMYPLAAVMLEEDQLLNRMRFDLVPKQ
ncbi:Synapse-associated protein 1 [Goodea atripinnis]|uniref:Synapse-associated protein 1 n=1 Tax=Goodea atripinnis TaxID=208336 RepID=A0ABV0MZC7_9TELE